MNRSLYFAILIFLLILWGFITASLRINIIQSGYEIERLEQEIACLKDKQDILAAQTAALKSPSYILNQKELMCIQLVEPQEWIK